MQKKMGFSGRTCLVGAKVILVLLGIYTTAFAQYGGTKAGLYEISEKVVGDKIAEFDAMRAPSHKWESSKSAILDKRLFENSIKRNRLSGFPRANRYQRYNYVVQDDKIRVAVWTKNDTVRNVCNGAPASPLSFLDGRVWKDVMVNFFPEDISLPNQPDPALGVIPKTCESIAPSGKATGVLDGHSKHFMLAQPRLPTNLSDYRPPHPDGTGGSGAGWARAKVAYAGEIVVHVSDNDCYYVINQNSGTYRPVGDDNGDFKYLIAIADLFKHETGTPPAAVWDAATKRLTPTTLYPKNGDPRLDCKVPHSETISETGNRADRAAGH